MVKMTIEDLARMINSSFTGLQKQIDERFTGVENRFKSMDERFIGIQKYMDERFDIIDKKFDNLNLEMTSVKSEIRRLWEKISDLEEQIKTLNKRTIEDEGVILKEVINLKKRVNFLEKKVRGLKTA